MKNTNVLGPHFGFTSVDMSRNKHMMIQYSLKNVFILLIKRFRARHVLSTTGLQ